MGGTFDISIGWRRLSLSWEGEGGDVWKREVVPPEPTLEKREEWHLGVKRKRTSEFIFRLTLSGGLPWPNLSSLKTGNGDKMIPPSHLPSPPFWAEEEKGGGGEREAAR